MSDTKSNAQGGAKRMAEDIFATEGDEITCREAARFIGLAADLLLNDADARQRLPALFQHLRFCPDCAEEYRMVSDYARREAAGQTRQPGTIPPVPSEFRTARPRLKDALIRSLFGGFTLAAARSAMRGTRDRWQATVELDDQWRLAVEVEASSADADLRTLHFRLHSAAQSDSPPAGGNLRLEAGGTVEQDAVFDGFGEAVLLDVLPGVFQLRLRLAGQEHLVEEFLIP